MVDFKRLYLEAESSFRSLRQPRKFSELHMLGAMGFLFAGGVGFVGLFFWCLWVLFGVWSFFG